MIEALKFAILGNSIDSMVGTSGFREEEIVKLPKESWIDAKAVEELRGKFSRFRKIIYCLGDDCGEVFDRLFIETLQKFHDAEVILLQEGFLFSTMPYSKMLYSLG